MVHLVLYIFMKKLGPSSTSSSNKLSFYNSSNSQNIMGNCDVFLTGYNISAWIKK
jgi:hypothetical protein